MANPAGSYIWYELMTPDPAAAKAFYDAVVGWDIAAESGRAGHRLSDDQALRRRQWPAAS